MGVCMTLRKSRYLVAVLALAATVGVLSGCQSVAGSQAVSLVRVIDASYNAPAVDVYVGQTQIAGNIAAPLITNYAILSPGVQTTKIDSTGTTKVLATVNGDYLASTQHSLYLSDSGTGFTATLLTDQVIAAPAGDFDVRFLQNANAVGSVDIYLVPDGSKFAAATPIVANLAPGQVTSYIPVAVGSYQLVIAPAGSTKASYTGSAVVYTSGQVRTLLITDQPNVDQQPINVVVGDDVD
uniref:DUF4397 domain-containing protein n=1 Tax=Acidobacterium capsulatum TaxID=33075 RepID=A0A7V4XQJ8_9BACT